MISIMHTYKGRQRWSILHTYDKHNAYIQRVVNSTDSRIIKFIHNKKLELLTFNLLSGIRWKREGGGGEVRVDSRGNCIGF